MKTIIKKVVIIISLSVALMYIGLLIYTIRIDRLTEDTTSLYTGTVERVEVAGRKNNIHANIYLEDYKTSLFISSPVAKYIGIEDLRNELTKGQEITFQIASQNSHYMNEVSFLDIVALKTDVKTIYSLNQYNEAIHEAAHPMRVAGIVMVLLLSFVSIFCLISIPKGKKWTATEKP